MESVHIAAEVVRLIFARGKVYWTALFVIEGFNVLRLVP